MKKEVQNIYDLHEQTVQWINEIEFMADEEVFLEHLLSAHFLDLSSSKLYDTTQKLIRKLKESGNLGKDLMKRILAHNKHVSVVIETFNKEYDKEIDREHQSIKKDLDSYVLKFRFVKKKIFNIIKEIMKDHKQKLLISKT